MCVFREESVAGMNRIDIANFRRGDKSIYF
jgi:hypothetical protein